ncbi:hypothetical protein BOX15_Mlig017911g2 [Macrostomum lignano]|uniref:PH domain-containing protein n=2 Tax=Macrostomum lignano TaxID=282301 RepID=A0A1I8GTF3_9PLAT|nr:hypothetical protein BOX15_Mlig017911g2 [Macrostomum lignano]
MRLINEKTVAKLCQTRHSSREGFLQYYQPQEQCSKCRTNTTANAKRQFFRLCGNMLYRFDPTDAGVPASNSRKARGVLLLVGHVVEPFSESDQRCDTEPGAQALSGDNQTEEESPSFAITWSDSWTVDSDIPACCRLANRRHVFTSSSAEEAALWIRAIIAASPECVSSRTEFLRSQLSQLNGEILGNAPDSEELSIEHADKNATKSSSSKSDSIPVELTRRNPFDNVRNIAPSKPLGAAGGGGGEFSALLTRQLDTVLQMMLQAERLATEKQSGEN